MVRTPICSQRSAPGKALAPKSSRTVTKPLDTERFGLVIVLPIWLPATAASNNPKVRSRLALAELPFNVSRPWYVKAVPWADAE